MCLTIGNCCWHNLLATRKYSKGLSGRGDCDWCNLNTIDEFDRNAINGCRMYACWYLGIVHTNLMKALRRGPSLVSCPEDFQIDCRWKLVDWVFSCSNIQPRIPCKSRDITTSQESHLLPGHSENGQPMRYKPSLQGQACWDCTSRCPLQEGTTKHAIDKCQHHSRKKERD